MQSVWTINLDKYSHYVEAPSGLKYLDLKVGEGAAPQEGQTCVVDWSGLTLGYDDREFQTRKKVGAYTGDETLFLRFKLGDRSVIPGFEEAVAGMKVGGIRSVLVPVQLGYPNFDFSKLGPRPTTLAGKQRLISVLTNNIGVDRTLLFEIELLAVR